MHKLWTKNFTIITVGSIISMIGNAIANFALGVLILEMTNSNFLFSLFLTANAIPKLIIPMFAGTFLDNFSRVKTIYFLDFFTTFIYLFIFITLKLDFLNFNLFILISIIIGSVDSIYMVAYDSLYPSFITKGNFSKAYSISSMIYPLAAFMTPLAALIYKTIGLEILFIVNSIAFFIAALFETKLDDNFVKSSKVKILNFNNFKKEFKSGVNYILLEKSLLVLTIFFFFNSLFQTSLSQTLEMPYFKNSAHLGYILYTYVSSANVLGRFIGGLLHYRFSINKDLKFKVAMIVYVIICFTHGFSLYLPISLMLVSNFITGLLSVTSFNIRISSTQAYIPDKMRGRFNGTFQMTSTSGVIIGQLLWGLLAEFYSAKTLILIGNMITLLLTYLIVYKKRGLIKPLYNQNI